MAARSASAPYQASQWLGTRLGGRFAQKFLRLAAKVKFGGGLSMFGDLKFLRYPCATSEKSAIISLALKAISGCIGAIDLKGT